MPDMDSTFLLFGFGSLVFAPEHPARVIGLKRARLEGFRRSFNRLARSRSCVQTESFDAFTDVPERFRRDGLNWSLAAGTLPSEGTFIDGLVVEYPNEVRTDVLRDTDRRESYATDRAPVHNGYLRRELEVQLGSSVRPALVYLANNDPANDGFVSEEVDIEMRAKLLINATPHAAVKGITFDARGLQYLEGIRTRLAERDIIDPDLETLAAAVLSFDGPWNALMTAPKKRQSRQAT